MLRGVSALAALAVLGACQDDGARSEYPQRPIKVVVPFAPGGGSDTFVRILKNTIDNRELLPEPLVILNVPGAGGSIGSRKVKDAPADGYTILNLHEALLTAKYSGAAVYGPEAFEPIAATGSVGMVVAVAEDAPYSNLNDLLDRAAAEPDSVVFSANLGAPSHFIGLLLEGARPGVRFRYTQTGGGAKRFAALIGGHIDVSSFSIAEYAQFRSAGLRALAFFGEDRHAAAPETPTALEQGVEVRFDNVQFWWAPKGLAPQKKAVLVRTLRQAMEAPETREALAGVHTDPIFLEGGALQSLLDAKERDIAAVAQRPRTPLPNLPAWVFAATVLAALWAFRGWRRRLTLESKSGAFHPKTVLAVQAVAVTAVYVAALQAAWPGYRVTTAVYVFGLGALLARGEGRARFGPALAAVAALMSVGLHYMFTNVFVIDLP